MNKNTMAVCLVVVLALSLVAIYAIESNKKIMLARAGNDQLAILSTASQSPDTLPKEETQTIKPQRTVISGFMRNKEQAS